ncbi:MAG: HAD family hydrolase [Acidimicrobiales bacterium]|nr:HAD family hydrolase [Acidimicrobiales bacterium]
MPPSDAVPAVVLFDLDGTLVDTNYLHVQAWQGAFRAAGHDVPTAWIHARIGMAGDLLLEELLGAGDHTPVQDGWRDRFRATRDEARPLPGATDLLRAVAERAARVVIASSSEEADADALVALLDADDVIHAVTSAGDVEEAKPSPEVFEVALRAASGTASRAIAVGDSVWDVESARRAGLDCIGLSTGGTAACALREAGAVETHPGPPELREQLHRGVLGRLLGD